MEHKYGFSKLVVGNLDASAEFYESVCGLAGKVEVVSTLGGRDLTEFIYGSVDDDRPAFVLMSYNGDTSISTGEAIVGFYTEDIETFVENAIAQGGGIVEEINERAEFHARIALLTDPEGHLVEVIEPLGKS